MPEFSGRTAIVTGAAKGIGRGVAETMGEYGAELVLADVDTETLDSTAADLRAAGHAVEAVECDVTAQAEAAAMVETALDRFGSVDVLVNNAGVATGGSIEDLSLDEWRRIVDVNLTGAFVCTSEAIPPMVEQGDGRIVNISSMAGRGISHNGAANYTASKWGLIGLTKHTAFDLGPKGVRANAVCPSATLTPLAERTTTEAEREAFTEDVPLGRWARPEDQAEAAAFLASDEAEYITGTVLEVDGGGQLRSKRENE
ncbi:3-oxoacyl-[acyl-carrier protein] reductase [Halarchaeum rubridurum]|uniref:3-oxoacyl-[acyl-carrier protein] reductase n=1 Tax=Halarchaeum rubridurum TaxID=489911 RepID=A0A830FKK5_9EURY|nr:SDR family NAD(P)-dependent oxidoreductase [Halarchaeum rubridurum]MBP1954784.1 3-oxoacyl-[acyl-carrier protein] reductase [Halarchaeum rubridurum]GGM59715.1 beta-ketoacyl-ACP reductase [Halarchaeum rubridurum]